MLTIKDVIMDQGFIDEVANRLKFLKAEYYNNSKYKRSALQEVYESGLANNIGEFIIEFAYILAKQSKLPTRQRGFIFSVCSPIFEKHKNKLIKELNDNLVKEI